MTTYTSISNALVAVGAKPFATTIQALRDNPLAISEGSTGAPVVVQGWHPYNSTLNGTGDGKFYDSAIHGAVASVETPAFSAGFEYMIVFESVGTFSTGTNATLALYRTAAAAYATAFTMVTSTAVTQNFSGIAVLPLAQRTMKLHIIDGLMGIDANNATASAVANKGLVTHTTATAIGKARFAFSSGNVTTGKMYLYRRAIL